MLIMKLEPAWWQQYVGNSEVKLDIQWSISHALDSWTKQSSYNQTHFSQSEICFLISKKVCYVEVILNGHMLTQKNRIISSKLSTKGNNQCTLD